MMINGLNEADVSWLKRIQRCDVRIGMVTTAAVLFVGVLAGALLLILGMLYGSSIAILSGAAELLVVPIVCAARYNMLRLYRIVQIMLVVGAERQEDV